MNEFKPTIGLEIHAQLKTTTKMFCDSPNDPDEKKPNVNICPVCIGDPGTLPVINKEAVRKVLQVGVAVDGEIADFTEFDRKNYFYPDIPKGYQISQYKYPLIKGGGLLDVELTRIHLEEDTARSMHGDAIKLEISDSENGSISHKNYSLIDYNRAGVPLMELVTEPVIKSSAQAGNFARELQLLLQTLGVSEANMEKGEMRVEANVSVSRDEDFGTKTEVKNLNSFRAVEKAIEYEIERQISVIEKGGRVMQETRGWDDDAGVTFSQRKKEESHDYRYFPDPDLPKLDLSLIEEFKIDNLASSMPELPWETRERYANEYGLKSEDTETYLKDVELKDLFEKTIEGMEKKDKVQLASNYITSDLQGLIKNDPSVYLESNLPHSHKITPENLNKLIEMVSSGKLSSRGAKDALSIMYEKGGDPEVIAEEHDLIQVSGEETLKELAKEIIDENPHVVEQYMGGDKKVIKFFVGQGMKKSSGKANPKALKGAIIKLLEK